MPKVDLLVVIVGNSGATSALPKVSDIILYVVVLPRFPCWNDANYQFKEPQSSHAFVLRLLEKPFLDEKDSISRNRVDARHGQIKGYKSYRRMRTNSLHIVVWFPICAPIHLAGGHSIGSMTLMTNIPSVNLQPMN